MLRWDRITSPSRHAPEREDRLQTGTQLLASLVTGFAWVQEAKGLSENREARGSDPKWLRRLRDLASDPGGSRIGSKHCLYELPLTRREHE